MRTVTVFLSEEDFQALAKAAGGGADSVRKFLVQEALASSRRRSSGYVLDTRKQPTSEPMRAVMAAKERE
jgi:hypothetical protein